MYFFNLKKLEEDLILDNIKDDEAFKYFYALMILSLIPTYFAFNDHNEILSSFFEGVLCIVISIIGIKKTFTVNKLGDGKNYFIRFFSLSFVVMFKLIPYSLIMIIPLIVNEAFFDKNYIFDLIMNVAFGVIFSFLYYLIIYKSIERVSYQALMNERVNNL